MKQIMGMYSWLNIATSGIRFGPDREAVRCELMEHIEDKAADLMRIFPDIPEEEARERALAAMGDPEEVKVQLARVHRPWLGYLWRASQMMMWGALALFLLICVLRHDYYQSAGFPLWMDWTSHFAVPADRDPERTELGGYTFQITEAAYWEEGKRYVLTMRVSSPRFWERLSEDALEGLSVLRPDGSRWTMGQQVPETGAFTTVYLARWGLFSREFSVHVPAESWESGDWVTLELNSGLGELRLSAQVTEEVAEP